ncbi:MAG: tetratricopeptide repeat protein [bacterium]|nr:tetratricopeptide repeat protein [bacterium]
MRLFTIPIFANSRSNLLYILLITLLIVTMSCSGAKEVVTAGPSDAELEQQRLDEMKQELLTKWSLGGGYFQQKDYNSAVPYLEQAKEIDTTLNNEKSAYPLIYKFLGLSYNQLAQHEKAVTELEKFLTFEPDDITTNNMLVYYYRQSNRMDKYIEQVLHYLPLIDDAEQKKPNLRNLKQIYTQMGENEKALDIVNQLLVFEPDNRELADERIGLLKATGGADAVKNDLEENARQYPNDTSYKWELVQIYEDESDYDNALGMLDQVLALQKDNADALERKLRIYWDLQQDETNAVLILNELSRIKPGDPEYVGQLAQISYENGKYREAISICERALGIDRNFGKAKYYMAKSVHDFADSVVRENGGAARFEDKLVFELAYKWYQDAAKDPTQRVNANRFGNFLRDNYVPTDEDRFMNKGVDKPSDSKYRWLLKYFN